MNLRYLVTLIVLVTLISTVNASVGLSIAPATGEYTLRNGEYFEVTLFNTGSNETCYGVNVEGIQHNLSFVDGECIPAGSSGIVRVYPSNEAKGSYDVTFEAASKTSGGVGMSAKVVAKFKLTLGDDFGISVVEKEERKVNVEENLTNEEENLISDIGGVIIESEGLGNWWWSSLVILAVMFAGVFVLILKKRFTKKVSKEVDEISEKSFRLRR